MSRVGSRHNHVETVNVMYEFQCYQNDEHNPLSSRWEELPKTRFPTTEAAEEAARQFIASFTEALSGGGYNDECDLWWVRQHLGKAPQTESLYFENEMYRLMYFRICEVENETS